MYRGLCLARKQLSETWHHISHFLFTLLLSSYLHFMRRYITFGAYLVNCEHNVSSANSISRLLMPQTVGTTTRKWQVTLHASLPCHRLLRICVCQCYTNISVTMPRSVKRDWQFKDIGPLVFETPLLLHVFALNRLQYSRGTSTRNEEQTYWFQYNEPSLYISG